MRIFNLLLIFFITVFIYGDSGMLVLDMSRSQQDAEQKVREIKREISNIDKSGTSLPEVKSLKVGNKWIVASTVKDKNEINRMSIMLRKEYPSALIIGDEEDKRVLPKREVHSVEERGFTLEWSILIAIGLIGIAGVTFVIVRASNIKKMQDDLEYQQKELMNKILKSEEYV